MHIVVCVKQVPDPEVVPSTYQLDPLTNKFAIPGRSPVINPFDEQAVEAALRIREESSEPDQVAITVLTIAEASPAKMIKHVLAMGADEGVVLTDPAFADADSFSTAYALAAAVRKLGVVDLILAGRQASDSDAGVVGLGVAELLGYPAVTFAKRIAWAGTEIQIDRVVKNGKETVVSPLPAMVTVAHEFGAVRRPSLRETMRASKKVVRMLDLDALGISPDRIGKAGARRVVARLYKPEREGECEWLSGDDPVIAARTLVEKLVEQKLI